MSMHRPVAAIATMGIACLLTNYGSFWQHYALRRKLRQFGFSSFRIQRPDDRSTFLQAICDTLYSVLVSVKRMILKEDNWRELNRQARIHRREYWRFRAEYKKLIGRPFEKGFDTPDVGIAGGDQVFCDCTPTSWLCTIPNDVRKISYAASTAWGCVANDTEWCAWAAGELGKFYAIGVRERIGCDLLHKLINKSDIDKTPDPVSLMSCAEWNGILNSQKMFARKTLFVYLLNVQSYEELNVGRLREIALKLNVDLKICGIQGTARFIPEEHLFVPSPSEFLRAIRDSNCFITNSFHGVVFAAIFNRNFVALKNENSHGNARIDEFLSLLCLQDNWIRQNAQASIIIDRIVASINWDEVNKTLVDQIEWGGAWLKEKIG